MFISETTLSERATGAYHVSLNIERETNRSDAHDVCKTNSRVFITSQEELPQVRSMLLIETGKLFQTS
jgi:hypothetical protein